MTLDILSYDDWQSFTLGFPFGSCQHERLLSCPLTHPMIRASLRQGWCGMRVPSGHACPFRPRRLSHTLRGGGPISALLSAHRYVSPSSPSSKDRSGKPGNLRSHVGPSHEDSRVGEPGVPDVPRRATSLPQGTKKNIKIAFW